MIIRRIKIMEILECSFLQLYSSAYFLSVCSLVFLKWNVIRSETCLIVQEHGTNPADKMLKQSSAADDRCFVQDLPRVTGSISGGEFRKSWL